MVNYSNPFLTSFLGSRSQFTQPQQNQFNQPQNQYDFSGWGDRLGKIEQGIAGLTEQFNNFQAPGDVDPEYQGNAAPEPLEQTANETGIESLVAEPTPATPDPIVPPPATPTGGQGDLGLQPNIQDDMNFDPSSRPGMIKNLRGNQFDWGLPMDWDRIHVPTITQELQNQYWTETGGPMTMGEEWDERAKEMGFDFAKQVRQGHKGRLSGEWTGTGQGPDRFNQLFEEAGGVLDRPEMGAAARYGEGFTNWLSGKGYEVYTEPQQEWMTQSQGGLGAFGRDDLGQDTSGYIPHLSQYAMTAEEMQDPTGTLKARQEENMRKHSEALNQTLISRGIDPEEYYGGNMLGFGSTELSNLINIRGNTTGRVDNLRGQGLPQGEQQYEQLALQAGVGAPALGGPTQQKIQQGLGSLSQGAGI